MTVANALKHAHPSAIIMQAELDGNELRLRICNDGTDSHPSGWVPGRGLNNIKSHAAEVGGSHEWGIEHRADNKRYCYLAVRIPLRPMKNVNHILLIEDFAEIRSWLAGLLCDAFGEVHIRGCYRCPGL